MSLQLRKIYVQIDNIEDISYTDLSLFGLDDDLIESLRELTFKSFDMEMEAPIVNNSWIYFYVDMNKIISVLMITQTSFEVLDRYKTGYYIYNICTESNYRCKGLTSSLIRLAIHDVYTINNSALLYLTTGINDDKPIGLYETLNFSIIDMVFFNDEDHVVMIHK